MDDSLSQNTNIWKQSTTCILLCSGGGICFPQASTHFSATSRHCHTDSEYDILDETYIRHSRPQCLLFYTGFHCVLKRNQLNYKRLKDLTSTLKKITVSVSTASDQHFTFGLMTTDQHIVRKMLYAGAKTCMKEALCSCKYSTIIKHYVIKTFGERVYRSTFSWPRKWMEMSGQLHSQAALS
jgi:hypothetical protein